MSVVLKICLPDKVFFEGKADKIILPVDEGTLTILFLLHFLSNKYADSKKKIS